MEALELNMLGRQLMKLGEEAMRGGPAPSLPTGPRLVMQDLVAHPDSAMAEITARSGLPQSYVSTSVGRLRRLGLVETRPEHLRLVGTKGAVLVDETLGASLGLPGDQETEEVITLLTQLSKRLRPPGPNPFRDLISAKPWQRLLVGLLALGIGAVLVAATGVGWRAGVRNQARRRSS